MNYIISLTVGYLIGSFPAAFIILKKSHGLDITQTGSGNVGALNSFRVTKSKRIFLLVLIIDFLKGFLSALLTILLFGPEFIFPMLSIIAAVFSHCYSPWLNLKGGKGLATATGGTLGLSVPIIIIWIFMWGVLYQFKRDINFASVYASIMTALSSVFGFSLMNKFSYFHAQSNFEFGFLVTVVMLIIISKHSSPLKERLMKKIN
jgi:glycerol-3-phosphate acyltransferase PlsY